MGDLAGRDVERGAQAGRAVALLVVGPRLDRARAQREHRLGPIEGLDLGLLVDRQDDRPLGRVEIQPDDVADLGLELRVGAELERLDPVRLQARLAQIPWTVVIDMPTRAAIRRALQWVVHSGGGSRLRAMTRSRSARL